MQTGGSNGLWTSMARRLALWGPTIVGTTGLIIATNAALSDEYIGAGVSLTASALSFGVIGHTLLRG